MLPLWTNLSESQSKTHTTLANAVVILVVRLVVRLAVRFIGTIGVIAVDDFPLLLLAPLFIKF